MMTKGCRAFLIAGRNVAAARNNNGATKNTRAQKETSPGPPADARPRGHRSGDGAPPRPRPTRVHEGLTQKARKFSARNICPNLDSRSKTDLGELKRKLSEHAPTQRKARAREEPSPGPPASKTDARPPGHQPRGGAPALPRFSRGQEGRPRKRASLARCKICDFGPELGFEQRNRFRSLRDTRRTKKKVLRKPPAGAPVVGQTFKYIY